MVRGSAAADLNAQRQREARARETTRMTSPRGGGQRATRERLNPREESWRPGGTRRGSQSAHAQRVAAASNPRGLGHDWSTAGARHEGETMSWQLGDRYRERAGGRMSWQRFQPRGSEVRFRDYSPGQVRRSVEEEQVGTRRWTREGQRMGGNLGQRIRARLRARAKKEKAREKKKGVVVAKSGEQRRSSRTGRGHQ